MNLPSSATELSRLHWTSLLFDVISHSRNYLIPALIAVFSAAKGNTSGLIVAGLIFIPALLTSVFRFFTLRYCIRDRQLIVTKGLVFRSVRTVPITRIQNVDFVQNVLHRIFQVAEVRVETASGIEPEATLRVLSMVQMERLRREIFELQETQSAEIVLTDSAVADPVSAEGEGAGPADEPPATPQPKRLASLPAAEQTLLEIPLHWLIRAGLASNRGMIMLGVLLGIFFQADFQKRFDFHQLEKFIPQQTDRLTLILSSILGIGLILLLLRVLGIGWFLLRFFGYRLDRRGDDLRISCGLLTKVSATVPRSRIQFISIHRNLIMRWMGYCSIRIETAGGAGNDHADATKTISRRWFVPIVPDQRLTELLNELRPGLDWDESQLDFQPLSLLAGRRMSRLAIIAAIVAGGIGLAISRPWGWSAGVIALPLFMAWATKKSRSMNYARMESGVVYRSGILNRKTSLTFFEKIQAVRIDQSPFDRRWNMARLSVDTAAAGPAEHLIEIPMLDQSWAMAEQEQIKQRAALQRPVFG